MGLQPETEGPYSVGISRIKRIAGMWFVGGYLVEREVAPTEKYQPKGGYETICHCKDEYKAVQIAELLNREAQENG